MSEWNKILSHRPPTQKEMTGMITEVPEIKQKDLQNSEKKNLTCSKELNGRRFRTFLA